MNGTIKINGVELTVSENNSSDIALASFSGFLATTAELSAKYGGQPGKKIAIVFKVVDGVVIGTFDKTLNPQKSYEDVIGTYLSGYALGTMAGLFVEGAVSGFIAGSVGGPVGAVVGAIAGAVIGGLYGDDVYNNGQKLLQVLADNLNKDFEYLSPTIYGKVTQDKFILEGDRNVMDAFPDYVNYRQITEIKSGSESFLYNQLTKEAVVTTSQGETKETEAILQKCGLGNDTYIFNLGSAGNIVFLYEDSVTECVENLLTCKNNLIVNNYQHVDNREVA